MSTHPLDDPTILSMLFYPRPARPGSSRVPNTDDGTIPIVDDIALGYRLYVPPQPPERVIVYFHGNGEVASDYDGIAELYFALNVALLVVDFRGYGWSTGQPLASTLLSDAEAVMPALPEILAGVGVDKPRFVMGRSLGSGPAIYLAHKFPDDFAGLIVESGFADMPSVMRRLGIPFDAASIADLPMGNATRVQAIHLPLLVIHGENDTLLPVEQGQQIYDASPAQHKTILRIPGAGHNNLLFVGAQPYFDALRQFVTAAEA